MHNGFYEKLDELREDCEDMGFDFMENIPVGNMDASDYLHGFCPMFALLLHEKYGYPIHVLFNYQEEMVHAYCTVKTNGRTFYVDIRGATSDFYGEFVDEFADFVTIYKDEPVIEVYEEERIGEFVQEYTGEMEESVRKSVEELIDDYADYYSQKSIERMVLEYDNSI